MTNGRDPYEDLAKELNEDDRRLTPPYDQALLDAFEEGYTGRAKPSEYSFLEAAQPLAPAPAPQITEPTGQIPSEGIKIPIETYDPVKGGETFELTLKPDLQLYLKDKPFATYNPETNEIIPIEPSIWAKLGGGALKGVEVAFAPFTAFGEAMALPFIGDYEKGAMDKLGIEIQGELSQIDAMEDLSMEERVKLKAEVAEKYKPIEEQVRKEAIERGEPLYGSIQEEYAKLPWWQQLLAELPSYIGAGGVVKAGAKSLLGRMVTAPLLPAEAIFRGTGAAVKGVGKAIGKIIPKTSPTAMPTIEELIAANYNPNIAFKVGQKLTNMPVAGRLFRRLMPMQAATTDAERATIAWMGQREIAPSLARIEMAPVYATKSPFVLEPTVRLTKDFRLIVLQRTPRVTNVKAKLPKYPTDINAIAEFPDRYILTPAQRAELDYLDRLLVEQLERELAMGVAVKPVALKAGQRYFPRFVKEVLDLETKALREIKSGMGRRPGIKPGSFRERYYEEVLDGILKGKRYSADIRGAVEIRLTAGNKAISDKMLERFLEPFGKIPRERIPTEIATRSWLTARQYAGIRRLKEVANRALRGEKPTEATVRAQERRFPELGKALRAAIGDKKALRQVINQAKALEPELKKAYWSARRARVKAMARAKVPIVGREGSINHAGLQGRIFPVEISAPTNALIRGEITPHAVLTQLAKLNAVARMGQTAIDTGFYLIQLLLTATNHPRIWGKAIGESIKTLINPRYVAMFTKMHRATQELIIKHGGAAFGSEFTEAARAGGWLSRIPVAGRLFGRFGGAFEASLDTARTLIVESKIPHYARKLGRDLTERELTDLVTTVDHMVGIGSLQRLGIDKFLQGLATNTLYAPRYYMAYVSFLGRAFQGGIGGDLARKSLAKFLVAIPTFMTGLAYATGQKERVIPTKDRPIPRMFDPRSGEFMTIEIANTHMGLGGVWIAGFRLLGSLVRTSQDDPSEFLSIDPHENPLLRYLYGRASPMASGAIDVATGQNYLGERLDTPQDYLNEIVDKTFPFWLAGQITDVPKAGWEKGLAEWWGLRAWMVQYREQAREYAEAHIKDFPTEMIMPWQREKIAGGAPLTYDDLNNEQRAWLLLNYEDYREVEEKRRGEKLEKGTDFEVADIRAREILDTTYRVDLEEIAGGVFAGGATIANYQDQAEYLRRIRAGEYQYRATIQRFLDEDRWEDIDKWISENIKPEDVAYDKYMEIRGNPPKVFGVPDWDAWKKNIDTYLASLDEETRAYILRRQDDWINNLPEQAQALERLLLETEDILDAYYAIEKGKPRFAFRDANPIVDAKLVISRGLKPRSAQAEQYVFNLLAKYGLPASALGEALAGTPTPTIKPAPTDEDLIRAFEEGLE